MKNLHQNKEMCIKTITAARSLLGDCLASSLIVSEVDKIAVSLINLENVLNANPDVKFHYKDILHEETGYFRRKEVPYLSMVDGSIHLLPFKSLNKETLEMVVYVNNNTRGYLPSSEHYILGNEAIGQVYIKGEKAFCFKFAVEHSLRSTAKRWYDGADKLVRIFERMI